METSEYMIIMSDGVARLPEVRLAAPVNFTLYKGEHIALVGANGSGKSLFVDMLLGRHPLREGFVRYDFSPSPSNAVYKNIQVIAFRDIYGSSEVDYCYQLRWNTHEHNDIPTVRELLADNTDCDILPGINNKLGIDGIIDKSVVMLSSGELRRLQIFMALQKSPRLLVLDNPFIGLDAESRTLLSKELATIASSGTTQMLLVLSCPEDIPLFVDSVIPVCNKQLGAKMRREDFMALHNRQKKDVCFNNKRAEILNALQDEILSLPDGDYVEPGNDVLIFDNVSVRYGKRTILDNLSWRVHSGEVWALSGRNGSGKSTLLSLVCADNLQSYSCNINLFGRRRGTGESIWDIKKRIGYVSPEMHRAYLRNLPTSDIVASGLFDTIGLYIRPSEEQIEKCRFWMRLFGIEELSNRSFIKLSSGEQRLALLARAFVKDPALLILDEPFHGLDSDNRLRAKAIIEAFSRRKGKSVIFVSHYEEELPQTLTHRIKVGV